jgi:hypothetical protein
LRAGIRKAMGAAQQVLWAIIPSARADYIAAWQRDLCQWGKLLASLPCAESIEDALEAIGLHPLASSFPYGRAVGSRRHA